MKNVIRMLALLSLVGWVVFSPSLASADYTVSWQDNGYGNDGNWYPMDSFLFLSGNSGTFGAAPTIGQPNWTGQIVNGSTAVAHGPGLAPVYFTMTVDFAGSPPTGSSYFEYFGYVGQTAVEGIQMFLDKGIWNCSWGTLDLGTAPSVSVPEPGMLLLLGSGLIGVVVIRRKFKS